MTLNTDRHRGVRLSLLALALTSAVCHVADPADYRNDPPATPATSSPAVAVEARHPTTDVSGRGPA